MLKEDAAESCGAEQFSFNRLLDSREVVVRSGRNPPNQMIGDPDGRTL